MATPEKLATKEDLLEPGSAAPAVNLIDQEGNRHKLSTYKGKWVVLYFYPKDDTPGCTTQACGVRDHFDELRRQGILVFGISPDNQDSHRRFAEKHSLPFPLLADTDKAVCLKYGVWQEKNNYGKKYAGVVRTTYLIDPTGKIAWRWDRVKPDTHAEDILAKVAELKA